MNGGKACEGEEREGWVREARGEVLGLMEMFGGGWSVWVEDLGINGRRVWGTERRDRETREGGLYRITSGEEELGGEGRDWAGE